MRKISALEAIRRFCVQCEGDSPTSVTECLYKACPFYAYRLGVALPFRLGKSPNVTTETREKRRAAYFRQTAAGKNVLGLISAPHSRPLQAAESLKSARHEAV